MANPHFTAFRSRVGLWLLVVAFISLQTATARPIPLQPDTTRHAYLGTPEQVFKNDSIPDTPQNRKLSPLAKGAAIGVAGAGIWTATFALADEPLQQFTQRNRTTIGDQISSFVQPLGRPGYMVPAAGVAFAGGLLLKDPKLQKVGLVSLGSILISSAVTGTLKNQFHRYRPSATTENHIFDGPGTSSSHTSLPSAHTTTAFAVATSVAAVYGTEYKFVPPIAYGVATLVGLSRINDNAHWATDVMAGALVGYISAKGTSYLYELVNQKLTLRKQHLLITPQLATKFRGVSSTLIF